MQNRRLASKRLYKRVAYDPDAAVEYAQPVADYVEFETDMPIEMKAWLADSLREMANVEPKANGEKVEDTRTLVLGRALGLKRRRGAPRFVDRSLIRYLLPLVRSGEATETELADALADAFETSPTTARKRIRELNG